MNIANLKTNRIKNPLGFELGAPVFSWTVESGRSKKQAAARIEVAADETFSEIIYDSGKRSGISSLGFRPGLKLAPRTRYWWRVSVWGDGGDSARSEPAWFETAKLDEPWAGVWITPDTEGPGGCPRVEKDFDLGGEVRSARVYASGLGLYRLLINGERVSGEYFSPGLNAYDRWVQYQTYDVTELLKKGANSLAFLLGDGIARGRFGKAAADGYNYCPKRTCICELRVLMSDGREMTLGSDESWKWKPSPVVFSNFYDGEIYDATIGGEWGRVRAYKPPVGELRARLSLPVVVRKELKPVSLMTTPKGETVLDMGQNMVGWLRFKAKAAEGARLSLYHGEILQDGCFYRDNLRSAKAEYHYISDGSEAEAEPYFTYFGFRYVRLEGFDEISPEDFTGCVVYSDLEETGHIKTSDERLNRLFLNALWGQRGNFLDVPTDCPQRDEKLGWTGDAQIFSGTACFNMDCQAFYAKYLADMREEQLKNGGLVPHVIPDVLGAGGRFPNGAVAWADAATIIPWNVYLHYGDETLLERQFESMKAWVDWTNRREDWPNRPHFGDWLALDNYADPKDRVGATDIRYLCLAFRFYSASLVSKAAAVLGREKEAEEYAGLALDLREKIRREYFAPAGSFALETQTACVVALFLGLPPEPEKTARKLMGLLKDNGMRLTTGFIGTPWLCRALSRYGYSREAWTLLLNEDCPSWLYEVKMGATTIWERWNSVLPDGHISDTGMNSLNHYAYGSIVEWLYRNMCGINPVEDTPGFKKILFRPEPDARLEWAECELDSASGRYACGWRLAGAKLKVWLRVPFDCEAAVCLPGIEPFIVSAGEHEYEMSMPAG